MSWHRRNIERMVRTHFADRNLNEVLGEATFGEQDGISYIEFEYLQPAPLENRGVDWLDEMSRIWFAADTGHTGRPFNGYLQLVLSQIPIPR